MHEKVGVERERVECDGDRALDRVLDWYDPDVDVATLDGDDDVRHVTERPRSPRGEIRLREQCLFGKCAVRPEEADRRHRAAWYRYPCSILR